MGNKSTSIPLAFIVLAWLGIIAIQFVEYGYWRPLIPDRLVIEGMSISPMGAWTLILGGVLACILCASRKGIFVSVPGALVSLLFLLEYTASRWTIIPTWAQAGHHLVIILAAATAAVVASRAFGDGNVHLSTPTHRAAWVIAVAIPISMGVAVLNGVPL